MKKMIYSLNVFIAGIALMCVSTANAATYTAVASGNWTSAATWGGTAPGNNLTFDNIVIPAGFTVTLNTDVEFNGGILFSMQVNGRLSSDANSDLVISGGSLTGNGTLELGYLEVSGLSTIGFTGDMNLDRFRNDISLNLNLGSHVNLSDTLFLTGGSLTLASGSNWTMETDAVIIVEGGSILLNGGIVTGTNAYHVRYTGNSLTSGIEATWAGMTNLTLDLADNSQVWSVGIDAVVNGEVKQMKGWIDLNGKDLTLKGNYNNTSGAGFRGDAASSLIISSGSNWTSNLMFDAGSQDLDNLHLNMGETTTLNLTSNLNIHGDLMLEKGEIKIMNGSSLTMEDNANVIVNKGSLATDNGIFNGTNDYNVQYVGTASETGIEMSGAGLNDVTLDLDEEEGTVTMSGNYTIHGDLHLLTGTLDLNEKDLTLNGGFHADGTGWMSSDANSNLTINGNASWTDTLFFVEGENLLDQLTLNVTGNHHILLGSDLKVNDLILTKGSVLIYDNTLIVASGGTITGADKDNYVMIDGNGELKMEMTAGGAFKTFPVGTMENYSPAMIQYNAGVTASFMVNVKEGVYAVGTYGANLSQTESVVDRTWKVSSSAGATSDIDMKVQWFGTEEKNGFDRTDARLAGFYNEHWDMSTMGSATTTSSGMYEMSRDGVSKMGLFALTDGQSALKVPENAALIAGVYPNPAEEILNIALDGAAQVELIDALGKTVSAIDAKESGVISMDLVALPAGMYYVKATANGSFTTQKVVKK